MDLIDNVCEGAWIEDWGYFKDGYHFFSPAGHYRFENKCTCGKCFLNGTAENEIK